jgi:hypothetical protein
MIFKINSVNHFTSIFHKSYGRCKRLHNIYIRSFKNRFLFGKQAPVYAQLVYCNPKNINSILKEEYFFSRLYSGMVKGGNWDLKTEPVQNMKKFKICRKRFVEGLSWKKAGAYDHMLELLKKKKPYDGCYDLDDVIKRYKRLDELYFFAKKNRKLLTQKELFGDQVHKEEKGIFIHFDRFGNPIFGGGGMHRFSISKILNLPVIPAQVGVVHLEALRNNLYTPRTHVG